MCGNGNSPLSAAVVVENTTRKDREMKPEIIRAGAHRRRGYLRRKHPSRSPNYSLGSRLAESRAGLPWRLRR